MRIVFMGTPDFAVPALVALHEAEHEIACVYTQPPARAGRGKKLRPSPVQLKAEALGFEVRSPKGLRKPEAQADFAALDADVAVVAAYGLILPQAVLDAPTHGCINIHASILPRWRGAAPIHRAIMAGDKETGVTIMQMEAGLDTGPMRLVVTTPIGRKTTGDLFDELAQMGASAIVQVVGDLDAHPPIVQDDTVATHAPKVDKAEARIDWTQSPEAIERLVRGLAPFPGAWFEIEYAGESERVKLLMAEIVDGKGAQGEILDTDFTIACADDDCARAVRPITLQRAGKPAMAAEEFLRGRPVKPGTILS